MQNYNTNQRTYASGKIAEFEQELITVQNKSAEWCVAKNVAGRRMRKRQLYQKLKPILTQAETAKKLGIPIANFASSPDGILAQVARIRAQEEESLQILRKEYNEIQELIARPDKADPIMKMPTDTAITKLPYSQRDLNTEEPFENSLLNKGTT